MERLTSQKKIILDYLKKSKNHPTAETVFLAVKEKLPQISQATIYRVLNNFKGKDLAQIINVKGIAHFDGDVSPHSHFICEECSKVYDVFDVCSKCNILKNKKIKVGKINKYKIYFYGKCKKCQ